MNPLQFPEANAVFKAPPGLSDSQVMPMKVFLGTIERGSLEGAHVVVAAWKPDEVEIELIKRGLPIYISFLGGLPPHFPCMSFKEAITPA